MSHSVLCKAIAEHLFRGRGAMVTLYEYHGYATSEFPDVLVFNGSTALYEIKTSRADFLAHAKKEARIKWRPKVSLTWRYTREAENKKAVLALKAERPELFYSQAPHLGSARYFVCEPGIISPEDLPEGWGLYWWRGGKMFRKAESKNWRPDVHAERDILAHALRRYASGDHTGILVNAYFIAAPATA